MLSLRHIAPAFVLVAAVAAADVSPFVGKWELDKKKTNAVGAPKDLKMEIEKDGGNGIVIKSQYLEPENAVYPLMWVGIMTTQLPLSIDGSEKKNQIGPFAHVSRTQVEGNRMTTDWKAVNEGQGGVEGQWIRTVSPDGKEMELTIISKASDGRNMNQTLYFKRD
jgi:hypothetical protein